MHFVIQFSSEKQATFQTRIYSQFMITEPGLPSVKSAQEDDCHLYDKIYYLRLFTFSTFNFNYFFFWQWIAGMDQMMNLSSTTAIPSLPRYCSRLLSKPSILMHLKPLSKCLSLIQLILMPITKQRKPIWPLYGETFDLDEDINVSIQHRLDLSFIYLTIQRAVK